MHPQKLGKKTKKREIRVLDALEISPLNSLEPPLPTGVPSLVDPLISETS